MSSVHKRKNSKYYYGAFRDHTGALVYRSTKTTVKSEARQIAHEWEQAAKRHATEAQIRRVFNDIHHRVHGRAMARETVKEYLSRWLTAKTATLAPATYKSYVKSVNDFVAYLGAHAKKEMGDMTVADLAGFRSQELGRTSPVSTRRRLCGILNACRTAWKEGVLSEDIASKLPSLPQKSKNKNRRPFTMPELAKVIEVADEEWRGMIYAGFYTGQRLGDVARMSWKQIDLQKQTLTLQTSKTGRDVKLPLAKTWQEWLQSRPKKEGPIFPRANAAIQRADGNSAPLSTQVTNMLKKAGLRKPVKKTDGQKRATYELSFHCLRYNATTMLKEAGVPEALVRDIIGHESAIVSRTYTVFSDEAKRDALSNLPAINEEA